MNCKEFKEKVAKLVTFSCLIEHDLFSKDFISKIIACF